MPLRQPREEPRRSRRVEVVAEISLLLKPLLQGVRVSRTRFAKCLLGLAALVPVVVAHSQPHQHGVVTLNVAVEGNKLSLALQAPLDNFLGFERAPRNDAERKAAAAVLARLRSVDKATALFTTDTAAQCVLQRAEVQAAVLEPITKPPAHDDHAHHADHAELEASYEFNCGQPAQLRSLTLGLFEAFARMQRVDVQVVGAKGQSKLVLKRPARSVPLTR
jgi:hypothetical protein